MSLITSQLQPLVTQLQHLTSFQICLLLHSMLQEEREKDKRKLNLIIHGIPESTSEIPVERKEHDT